MNPGLLRWSVGLALVLAPWGGLRAADTGFQPEVRVKAATRLDWQFAAGPTAALPPGYDSGRQRFQLYVPKGYSPERSWPLLVFVAPGDEPEGWRRWPQLCEEQGLLFCAAYGAGNACPPVERTRIVLDVFDDVRRRYRVDPDQTYAVGFSEGAALACTLAYALPEYFGGIVALGGAGPLNPLPYLRHRAQDRLSVALVTGATDPRRRDLEDYWYPYFTQMRLRARLWRVPDATYQLPAVEVLAEVQRWLAEDLRRRRADTQAHAPAAGEMPTPARQAALLVERAEADLRDPEKLWRGVALLQGVEARWEEAAPAAVARARRLLDEIKADPGRSRLAAEQGGAEERHGFAVQATAWEQAGNPRRALAAWQRLAQLHPDTPEGRQAAAAVQRLAGLGQNVRPAGANKAPFLGLAFRGDTTTVAAVAPKGPAAAAGVRAGDVLARLGKVPVPTRKDVLGELETYEPGDKVRVEVLRGGKPVALVVELGVRPNADGK
jgi:dienelactone hydrolase